jgi:hypothetical protein
MKTRVTMLKHFAHGRRRQACQAAQRGLGFFRRFARPREVGSVNHQPGELDRAAERREDLAETAADDRAVTCENVRPWLFVDEDKRTNGHAKD